MKTSKSLILLESTEDYWNRNYNVTKAIKNICDEFNISFEKFDIHEIDDVDQLSCKVNQPADYLIVGAHGSDDGFGTKNGSFVRWADFSLAICDGQLINPNSVVFLGCCESGFKRGALSAFVNCDLIDTICGAACNINGPHIALALRVFLIDHLDKFYNAENAKKRICSATNIPFEVFHRLEMDVQILDMFNWKNTVLVNNWENTYPVPEAFFTSQQLAEIASKSEQAEAA